MNCMNCGAVLSDRTADYCPHCGANVLIQKKVNYLSKYYYNQGLEKAQVRDLSGAIACLKQSLTYNKRNIAARNLLGLAYFETGEVVAALEVGGGAGDRSTGAGRGDGAPAGGQWAGGRARWRQESGGD